MAQTRAIKYSDDGVIDYTPASAMTAGDIAVVGNVLGIAINDIPASKKGSLVTCGIYKIPKKTGAISQGVPIFWNPAGTPVEGDATSGAANVDGVGTYAGISAEAALSGDTYVAVVLNQRLGKGAFSVAPTGSTQADAATLGVGLNVVTGSDGTKGVILPAASAGLEVTVKNVTAQILKIYPATGDAINALSANASYNIAASTCVTLHCLDGTTWYSCPLVAS